MTEMNNSKFKKFIRYGDLQNDLLFRIRKIINLFQKDQCRNPYLMKDMNWLKRLKPGDVHMIKLLFSSIERRLKRNG